MSFCLRWCCAAFPPSQTPTSQEKGKVLKNQEVSEIYKIQKGTRLTGPLPAEYKRREDLGAARGSSKARNRPVDVQ